MQILQILKDAIGCPQKLPPEFQDPSLLLFKMPKAVANFIKTLKNAPAQSPIFNPWYDVDPDNDQTANAPKIRRKHLQLYLEQRIASARYLLIAEAVGYQGAHFSGVAMTSERILLGNLAHRHISPSHVFKAHDPKRTSQPEKRPLGFTEPTATIVWSSLLNLGINPYEFVLWNAVPWHPYQPQHPKGMLTNRTPTSAELEYSQPFLHAFLELFPNCHLLAIGKKCASMLETLQIECHPVRHPANGGATQFREQTHSFLKSHGWAK